MRPSSSCLVTSVTPLAIVDLELAFNHSHAMAIKEIWAERTCDNAFAFELDGAEAAVINIILDFPFLVAYTMFLVVLIVISSPHSITRNSDYTTVFVLMAITAGLLDVIENLFMLVFLQWIPISSLLFAVPATIKFILILFLMIAILYRFASRFNSK